MKNYLKRTFLFGITEGAVLLLFIRMLWETNTYFNYRQPWYRGVIEFNLSYYHFLLYTTIVIAFIMIINFIIFITLEILPHRSLDNLNSKPQMWDKISLYILLTLTSIGLPSIWLTIRSFLHPSMWDFSILIFGPISLFYGAMAFAILLRLFTTAENEASVKNNALQDEVLAAGDLVVTKFNISQSLLVAAISCGVAGGMYAIGTSLSPRLFRWFFYPLGDYISGMTIVYVLGQLIPSIRSRGILIVYGFIIGSILDLSIGHPIYYSFLSAATNPFISQFVWNFFSIIAASITMSVVIGKISRGSSGRVFVYWLFANVLQNLFYVTTSSNPIIVSFIGMAIFGVVGCFLTIKEIQESISNTSLNTQE